MEYLNAFLCGGLLCAVGQIILDKTSLTPARILTGYVVAGVLLQAGPAEEAKANITFFSGRAVTSFSGCTLLPRKTTFLLLLARNASRIVATCV